MKLNDAMEGGTKRPVFQPTLAVDTDVYTRNVRSALERDLPGIVPCAPHDNVLSIVGGGPSIANTYQQLDGYVVGINGSGKWLRERGVRLFAIGLLDPRPRIADNLLIDNGVRYFVSSTCAPEVFDKLDGKAVTVFHPSGIEDVEEVVKSVSDKGWLTIGGGSTMGLRWITLGWVLGFRHFKLHGMDSSFGETSHAYPDVKDRERVAWFESRGRWTSIDMLNQVAEFFCTLEMFEKDPIKIEVFGDGLLQDAWKVYQNGHPGRFA